MVPYLSERENAVEHINAMCMHLFDLWCESRSVVPLAHLLKGWPLTNSDPEAIRRLGNALRDLRRHHVLDPNGASFHELCELSDCVEDLLILSSMATWTMNNG
ncbi:hypothetical protein R69927_00817 [Paraburkholderia domus]|jgi:hypothetical protein|uniref:Uncharacterized protein n=1 Tax=Paraburkholderia domus TaxID=2793075 RepID=A0A9N8MM87_9BURK|nr:hypothetical protein [Paraburkholderia domus]MBK5049231.1 hypothetical protein [Burkholderia sp. R-70006]MBK5060200.1 hypothetical protein [Burkholderia sp. R-70199]MBK5085168.1 hypothetical protein [Burkholderia sp. R-69927]MBK5118464.1 hypothetical protein [Burkholderia sp. R-69980]MBK5164302.1 hypothetical protein [Burkholderia sp. R-70211]MBK5179661.1 hypothetical protein [Burkholderia sp. R-69749]